MECLDFKSELIHRKEELKSSIERFLNTEVIDKQRDYPLLRHGISGMKSKMFVEVLTGKFNSFQPETKVLLLRLSAFSKYNCYLKKLVLSLIKEEKDKRILRAAISVVPFIFKSDGKVITSFIDMLINTILNRQENIFLRRIAANALGYIGKYQTEEVRFRILDAFLKTLQEDFEVTETQNDKWLIRSFLKNYDLKYDVITAMVELLEPDMALVKLIELLYEDNLQDFWPIIKSHLIKIGRNNREFALRLFVRELNSKDDVVKSVVIDVLEEIYNFDECNEEVIMALLEVSEKDEEESVRDKALAALERIIRCDRTGKAAEVLVKYFGFDLMGNYENMKSLVDLLNTRNRLLKAAVISILNSVERFDETTINTLLKILIDSKEDGFVRRKAAFILKRTLEKIENKSLKVRVIKALEDYKVSMETVSSITGSFLRFLKLTSTFTLKKNSETMSILTSLLENLNNVVTDNEVLSSLFEIACTDKKAGGFIGAGLAMEGVFINFLEEPKYYFSKYFRSFVLGTRHNIQYLGETSDFYSNLSALISLLKASFAAHSEQMLKFDSLRGAYNFLKISR